MTVKQRCRMAAVTILPSWSVPAYAVLGGAPDDAISLWRVVGSLLLCLALAIAGAFALRTRMGRGSILDRLAAPGRRLKVEESLRVTTQLQVAIIRCDDKEMLIAATPSGTPVMIPLAGAGER